MGSEGVAHSVHRHMMSMQLRHWRIGVSNAHLDSKSPMRDQVEPVRFSPALYVSHPTFAVTLKGVVIHQPIADKARLHAVLPRCNFAPAAVG